MNLEEDFGTIKVTSTPAGLPVWLDGEERGKTPLSLKQIPSGEHEVRVKSRCHHDKGETFNLGRGKAKSLKFRPNARQSAVQVQVKDKEGNDLEDVQVWIDGKRAGKSFETIKTSLCAQRVEARHPKLGKWSETLSLRERKTSKFKATLGVPSLKTARDAPMGVMRGTLAAGGRHTCGLKKDGSVSCWGENDDGQSTPKPGAYVQLAAGGAHTCGLKKDGSVSCWGTNRFGQSTPPKRLRLGVP
jgi:hypothetical protein